jgi:hypothetical protein
MTLTCAREHPIATSLPRADARPRHTPTRRGDFGRRPSVQSPLRSLARDKPRRVASRSHRPRSGRNVASLGNARETALTRLSTSARWRCTLSRDRSRSASPPARAACPRTRAAPRRRTRAAPSGVACPVRRRTARAALRRPALARPQAPPAPAPPPPRRPKRRRMTCPSKQRQLPAGPLWPSEGSLWRRPHVPVVVQAEPVAVQRE